MVNLSRDNVKKVDAKPRLKLKPKLKSFDMSNIEVNFFDVLKAMHNGKAMTIIDTSSGEPTIITSKMYRKLLKEIYP